MVQAELPPLAKRSHLLGRFAPGNVSTALAWVVMRAKDIGTCRGKVAIAGVRDRFDHIA